MIVAPGSVQVSVDVQWLDDSGFPVTGKVAADFPVVKWSPGNNVASATITLSDLAAITTAHPNDNTAGGVKEREGGWYRLDLPNNMFSSAGRKTLTFAEATNKRIIAPPFDVQYVQGDVEQWKGATAPAMTGDAYAVVNHGAYGNAQLVRSTTPANTLAVDANHLVAVPDTQKVDVNTVKTQAVTCAAGVTFNVNVGTTQPVNFTGAGASALAKVNVQDTAGTLSFNLIGSVDSAGTVTGTVGGVSGVTFPATVASSTEVTSIQNNTRCVRVVPDVIERPDSGTTTYRIELLLYDEVGNMEAPDSAPTLALVNQSGTDLSSRLASTTGTLVSTGRYRWTYTASVSDTLEQLVWAFSVVEGGATRVYGNTTVIVDTTAVDFTSTDRTTLSAVSARVLLALPAVATGGLGGLPEVGVQVPEAAAGDPGGLPVDSGGVLTSAVALAASQPSYAPATVAALAALAGKFTGITLIARWLGALAGKTADTATRAEINATTAGAGYNEATDSLEAQRDNGPAALGTDVVSAAAVSAAAVTKIQTGLATPTNITAATGVVLAAAGLDAISATPPNGVATTFREKLMQLWSRFFGRVKRDATTIKTYRPDGTTVAATQTYTASGSDEDIGAAT